MPRPHPALGRRLWRTSSWRWLLALALCASSLTSLPAHAQPEMSVQWRQQVRKLPAMAWKPRSWGTALLSEDGRRLFAPSAAGLTAHRVSDGREIWRLPVADAVQGQPAQRGDVLYTCTSAGEVYALDGHSGRGLWKEPVRLNAVVYSPVAVGARHVYVVADPGLLTAIDRATGKIAWRHNELFGREFLVEGHGGAMVLGEVVYVGMPSGKLLALATRDGGGVWEVQLGESRKSPYTDVDTTPVAGTMPGGQVAVLAAAYNSGLFALSAADGATLWRYQGEGYGDPVVADGRVYTLSAAGALHVVDLGTGRRVMARRLPGTPSGRLALSGDLVLVPGGEGLMAVSASTGHVLSRIVDEFGFAAAPLVIGGRILAVSNGGLALSLRLTR